ncbi:MAG: carboxymuconolactone decarboxylase family protein [Hydrogenophilaceae bacterium]|jgi:alkyl hydroperoxide reductase subunit D|nr:carboxymuconolactone decarboxylase family protein [Hydrogenophilaceae bacterium]
MPIDALREALPDFAWDQKRNLDAIITETLLSDQQRWGCLLACAYATDNPTLIRHMESAAGPLLSDKARNAAKLAATLMAMNTVYYGALNLLDNHDYRGAPANLSMTALSQTDVDKIDFELWAFAISAMAQCGACLNVHESELHKRGVTLERVQAALRIAATVNAMNTALRIKQATAA